MSARDALERRDWKAAMDVPEGGGGRNVEATRWFARGLGAARAAWPGGQGPLIAVAREAAQKLDALAAKGSRAGRSGVVELQRLGVLAAIASAAGGAGRADAAADAGQGARESTCCRPASPPCRSFRSTSSPAISS